MKAEPQHRVRQFNPIVLTLETPEEVASLYALVNHRDICAVVDLPNFSRGQDWDDIIRVANEDAGNPTIDYDAKFNRLAKIVRP